jgi:hypothetical protein
VVLRREHDPADAGRQHEDAEPSVHGDGGAFRDVDPGSLVPDGGGGDRRLGDAHGVLLIK